MRQRTTALLVALTLVVASVAGATPALGQSGMTGVPDSNVTAEIPDGEDPPIPAEDLQGRIEASQHASTLEVTVTTPSHAEALLDDNATVVGTGDLALLLADDSNHDGRDVSVPAKPVVQALGYAPEQVRGLHSSGSEWSSEVRYVDDQMIFYVPEFSSNTVTFTGTVEISGNPATDGSSYSYSVSDPDAVEDFSINLTGRTVQERDTESATVSDGGSMSVSVAGTTDPKNPDVTFVGVEQRQNNSWSGTGVSAGSSTTVTVGGNVAPENGEITVTGSRDETSQTVSESSASNGATTSYAVSGNVAPEYEQVTFYGESSSSNGDQNFGTVSAGTSPSLNNPGNIEPTGPVSGEPRITVMGASYAENSRWDSDDGEVVLMYEDRDYERVSLHYYTPTEMTISELKVKYGGGLDGSTISGFDVYISNGYENRNWREGTQVINEGSWVEPNNGEFTYPNKTHELHKSATVSGHFEIEFLRDGGTNSLRTLSHDTGGSHWVDKGPSQNYFPAIWAVQSTNDIAVSAGGSTASFGDLSPGETKSKPLDLSASDGSLSVGGAGPVDLSIDKTDRTASENPAVDVDGDGSAEAGYSGVLTSGETVTRSVDLSRGSSTAETTLSGGTVSWDLDYTEVTVAKNPGVDVNSDGVDEATVSGTLDAGETATRSVSGLSAGSNTLDFAGSGAAYDYSLSATERTHTEDPSVDTDGDSVGEVSYSGILSPGETVSSDAPEIGLTTTSLGVGTGAGQVTVEAAYTEVVQTSDVTVEVNGEETTYVGTLSDGEQVSLTTDPTWIQNGTNRVNVSISSPGGDAPPAAANFNYSHDALDQQAVAYDAETFSERYEVSKTFSEGRADADLTIPFKGQVLSIRTIERQQSDGSWESVKPADYTFSGTELTVDLGRVDSGETVAVRAVGTKARVERGSIRVTETTTAGQSLDSKLTLVNWTDGAYIELPNGTDTEYGSLIHHAYSESYTGASDYVTISQTGEQRLHLPKAADQSTVRVKTIPVAVNAKSGEVEVSVANAVSSGEPTFSVRPGASVQDEVEYTFVEAQDGEDYVLFSQTMGIQRDSGTANSPVTLVDDDSDETLVIQPDSENTSTSSSTGGVPMVGIGTAQETAENTPIVLVVGVALIVALYFLFRRMGWLEERDGLLPVSPAFAGAAGLIGFVVIDFASGRRLTAALGSGLSQIVPLAGIVGVALAAWWAYRRFIKGSGPRPIQIVGRGGDGR